MSRMLLWVVAAGLSLCMGLLLGCDGNESPQPFNPPPTNGYTISVDSTKQLAIGQEWSITPVVKKNGQVVEAPQLTWTTAGGIGEFLSTGATAVFKATSDVAEGAQKTGTITVQAYGKTAVINVTVVHNPDVATLTDLQIAYPEGADLAQVTSGTQIPFTATAQKTDGTRVDVAPTWTVQGGVGTISETGLFRAGTAGTGRIVATLETLEDSVVVTVVPGAAAHLEIIAPEGVDLQHLRVGDQVQFQAAGYDQGGNRKASRVTVHPTWSVEGGIGTITEAGLFTATAMGDGAVVASVEGLQPATQPVTVSNLICGTIAFVRQDLNSNIGLLNAQGSLAALTSGDNKFTDPDWSPDGTKLAIASRNTGRTGIAILDTASNTPQLVYEGQAAQEPAWSHDGTRIAFANGMLVAGKILVLDLLHNNAVEELATGITGNPSSPTWSPDDSKLAFCNNLNGISQGVYVIDADGTHARQIFDQPVAHVRWSTNQDYIAASDAHHIYLLPSAGGNPETVVSENGMLTGGFAWAPDGSALVYGVREGTTVQLYVKYLHSNVRARLTNLANAFALEPCWKD